MSEMSAYSTQTEVVGKGLATQSYNESHQAVLYKIGAETICQHSYDKDHLVETYFPKHNQSVKHAYNEDGQRMRQVISGQHAITFHYSYDELGREVRRDASDGTIRIIRYIEDFLVIAYSNTAGKWFTRIEKLDGTLISFEIDTKNPL